MKCRNCQMENIEGAFLCEECGSKLETADQLKEIAFDISEEGKNLVLMSPDGCNLEIPSKDDVVIGREDPISEVFPDVDLTALGGLEKGVSRKHAVIHRTGADYTVEDMGSTNGTFINRKRIQPHAPESIKPGDEVRFGKLSLSVKAA